MDQQNDPFTYHKYVDTDIIQVSKNSLLLIIQESCGFFSSTSSAWGWSTASLTMLSTGLFTETVWGASPTISAMIRGGFIVGGIIAAALAAKSVWTWYTKRKLYEPRAILETLMTPPPSKPIALLPSAPISPQKTTRRSRPSRPIIIDQTDTQSR